jgi:hypothetical protein
MNIEIWKDIKGYEGLYQVSNKGNVKSLNRITINSLGYKRKLKGKYKLQRNIKGYSYTTLHKKGIRNSYGVHRLVAISFIENKKNKPQINHINGNKKDNRVENLEWCNASENQLHNYRKLNRKISRAFLGKFNEKHPNSKKIKQFDKGGNLINIYNSVAEVQRVTGFLQGNISSAARGDLNQAYNYYWEYVTTN